MRGAILHIEYGDTQFSFHKHHSLAHNIHIRGVMLIYTSKYHTNDVLYKVGMFVLLSFAPTDIIRAHASNNNTRSVLACLCVEPFLLY